MSKKVLKTFNQYGVIKLQDDLTLDYGLYTGDNYYELKDLLSEYICEGESQLTIIDRFNNEVLFKENIHIANERLEGFMNDILFDLTGKKVLFSLVNFESEVEK